MGERIRKVRSDKKKDVKPTVDLELYNCVSRISHITYKPMKDVGEAFCLHGLYSRKVIDYLSKSFRRNYDFESTVYIGDPAIESKRVKKKANETARLTMRFLQKDYDQIAELAYSLDTTISSATSYLLHASVQDTDIVNEYVSQYVEDQLDDNRKKQLKLVLEYIRKENPYTMNEITLAQLLSYIMDNVIGHSRDMKRAVENWLDSVTKQG